MYNIGSAREGISLIKKNVCLRRLRETYLDIQKYIHTRVIGSYEK